MLVMAVGAVSPALGQFKDESKYGDLRNYCPLAARYCRRDERDQTTTGRLRWSASVMRRVLRHSPSCGGGPSIRVTWTRCTGPVDFFRISAWSTLSRACLPIAIAHRSTAQCSSNRCSIHYPKAFVESLGSLPDAPTRQCQLTADKATTYLGDQLPDGAPIRAVRAQPTWQKGSEWDASHGLEGTTFDARGDGVTLLLPITPKV